MDRHNNQVAAEIGEHARQNNLGEDWVIAQCQEAVKNGGEADANGEVENGNGGNGGLIWLPPDQWRKNPAVDAL